MSEKKFTTTSGIEIKEVYCHPSAMNEMPGEFPFTRGIQKDMYRGKLWTMRQYAGFSTAEESNKRYHYLLDHGVSGLSVTDVRGTGNLPVPFYLVIFAVTHSSFASAKAALNAGSLRS